jgi:hypothetical protein
VDERWSGIRALVEWLAAAAAVALVLWMVWMPVQRAIGPRLQAAIPAAYLVQSTPPGVPASATMVPVLLLEDGREVRQGDLRSQLDAVISPALGEGPPVVSSAQFGERHTRAYRIDGVQIYIVCEPSEPDGPMRVAGIYLP